MPQSSSNSRHDFIKGVLTDVAALDHMIEHDWFESDITRIGAEQEVVLIESDTYRPAPAAIGILDKAKGHDWLVGELSKFNLELNLDPRVFEGNCLGDMELELSTNLKQLHDYLSPEGLDYVLTGVLPTLQKYHLGLDNLTPKQRYIDLMKALHGELMEKNFELRLVGIDELLVKHDSPLLEACNTSFQVHLQVTPDTFVRDYNFALALTAPSISVAANSPIVFGKRLWHETRIALFQQAIDTRKRSNHMRQMSPRVILGDKWLTKSVSEIFKEDIARFRTLMTAPVKEDSMHSIKKKKVPKLGCLQLNNSTVYRWNRPCGPTVLDEMANTAFWLGAMKGMAIHYDDITKMMSFDDVRDNFGKSARFGIDTKFTWMKDTKVTVQDLVLKELLPLAKEGLQDMKVTPAHITRYLDVIEGRMEKHMNGARWALRSYTRLAKETSSTDEALTNLVASMHTNQNIPDHPVHKWKESELADLKEYRPEEMRVSEVMQTELITAHKSDLVQLVAKLMKWRDLTYMPVEDKKGNIVGLLTLTDTINRLVDEQKKSKPKDLLVKDVMLVDPVIISPEDTIKKAIKLMKEESVGCLPVVNKKELVGMLTNQCIVKVTDRMMK